MGIIVISLFLSTLALVSLSRESRRRGVITLRYLFLLFLAASFLGSTLSNPL